MHIGSIHTAVAYFFVTGQISASLASFSRTIGDYAALAKSELIPEKKEKAIEREKSFRTALADYRQQFERLRKEREDTVRVPSIATARILRGSNVYLHRYRRQTAASFLAAVHIMPLPRRIRMQTTLCLDHLHLGQEMPQVLLAG
jgi:hypothetical protein